MAEKVRLSLTTPRQKDVDQTALIKICEGSDVVTYITCATHGLLIAGCGYKLVMYNCIKYTYIYVYYYKQLVLENKYKIAKKR